MLGKSQLRFDDEEGDIHTLTIEEKAIKPSGAITCISVDILDPYVNVGISSDQFIVVGRHGISVRDAVKGMSCSQASKYIKDFLCGHHQ